LNRIFCDQKEIDMQKFVENTFASKELYLKLLNPVCEKYGLTQTEMVILMSLTDNPGEDTATGIIKKRKLKKSVISVALRSLQEKGYVIGEHKDGNHRSIHLQICEAALPIIASGKEAQEQFVHIMLNGFSDDEKKQLKNFFDRITANIAGYSSSEKE